MDFDNESRLQNGYVFPPEKDTYICVYDVGIIIVKFIPMEYNIYYYQYLAWVSPEPMWLKCTQSL